MRHQLESAFGRAEVRHPQEEVCPQDAHQRHIVDIVSLGHHLSSHENLRRARFEVPPQGIVSRRGADRLAVHSGDPSRRKPLGKRLLDLFGTLSEEL